MCFQVLVELQDWQPPRVGSPLRGAKGVEDALSDGRMPSSSGRGDRRPSARWRVGLRHEVTQLALDHLQQAFGRHGYVVEADWRPSRVAVVADGARRVDLHPIVFDAQRFRPSMPYTSIDSAKVNCPALRD